MKDFERGAKRKCSSCSTLFFDFNKFPIKCPNCGADVTSLLTNVSKRGRPPKNPKVEVTKPKKEENEIKIEDIPVDEAESEDIDQDDSPVEEIIEIKRDDE